VLPVVLRNRPFARLWAAESITQFGGQLTYLSLPLAAYASTGSTTAFAGVFMASSLGIMLTMLVGGALADRFDRQRMMLASDLVMLVVIAALGVAVVSEAWLLAAVCAFAQTTAASLLKAGDALQRDIVADADRAQANALTTFALHTNPLAAPLLGMAVFLRWGFIPIIAFDLATTVASFFLLLGVRDPRRARQDVLGLRVVARRVLADIHEGGRIVWGDRWLRRMLPGNVLNGLANGMFIVAVIPWIDHTLDLPPSTFGVMIAVIGASGLVASLVVTRIAARVTPARLIAIGSVLGIVGAMAFVVPLPIAVVYVGLVIFGGCNVAFQVGGATARQRRFRGDVQGRLGALQMVNGQACRLAGMALATWLAGVVDSGTLMASFGVGVAASCALELLALRALVADPIVADDVVLDGDLAVSG
jgi:MFS family permease